MKTEHITNKGTKTTRIPNKLAEEKSPYLLQHAYNPVNWYPWCDEAFDKAKNENKAIFLSIGYSTCHWCHVMERESFEDKEVAAYLNQHYVSIKVDREERPDIDHIYMNFCQATTGQGGWPLSVFLTPKRQPFYAGTYFPKNNRNGYPGFIELLQVIHDEWQNERGKIENLADEIYGELQKHKREKKQQEINPTVLKSLFLSLEGNFDSKYGGFGRSPKFPTPHNLLFLLRYYKANQEEKALNMVKITLDNMYKGGIFDHIGGGFSRYSTDKKWLVPHFEKMLYDNALLIMAYTETYQITKNIFYKEVAQKIIGYIVRDMRSPDGGFYSAEDADSEGVEGKYYVWSKEELVSILGEMDANIFCDYYNVLEKGNFEGKNILNLIGSDLEKLKSHTEISQKANSMVEKVLKVREKRIHPYKDDKILTSWNGLMITALSIASKVFDDKVILNYAQDAYRAILDKMVDEKGRLYARYRDNERRHLGYLDDYANIIWASIELYETTYEMDYLKQAVRLSEDVIKLFGDETDKGFYLYGKDAEELITRPKDYYDGAIPSGNSVIAYNLLRLGKLTGRHEFEDQAKKLMMYFGKTLSENPMMYGFLLTAYLFDNQHAHEIVIAGENSDPILEEMKKAVADEYLPFSVVLINSNSEGLGEINSFASDQKMINGKTTAYICENFTCKKPIHNVEDFNRTIKVVSTMD